MEQMEQKKQLAELLKLAPHLDTLMGEDGEYQEAADFLIANGVRVVPRGHWLCEYDKGRGETDVTCSHCGITRTVNGCYVSVDGEPLYDEDDFCPDCGAVMDE